MIIGAVSKLNIFKSTNYFFLINVKAISGLYLYFTYKLFFLESYNSYLGVLFLFHLTDISNN